ncbi:alanine dehydrogenase [Paenibacillus curdlanolyticus YK9]|uniref:Alanine dehydrogenase n=1 Tax=Paenibacillus curdlanolyticus YK9 TaxID=717606 RepID=E0IG90_9BACL|nr:alanine dehydrogenase [Paenibacillus curdlanolyticus]EFM08492.1 alanine dehydrogenase [Paenibacillus curdlanolyticus YK9]
MIIGIPKEIKNNENRVGLTPAAVSEFVRTGHEVLVETEAGVGSGFSDFDYKEAGAVIVPDAAVAWSAEMVIKVKEPLPSEYAYFRPDLILYAYLHLASEPELTRHLLERKVVGIGYETIQSEDGGLPLLLPMSEVAGRMAVQIGAGLLEKSRGGKGVLLGGVPGVQPAEVVILGGGVVGTNAAKMAVGLGANVTIFDVNPDRLRWLDNRFDGRVHTRVSHSSYIAEAVRRADLLIGAVLIPGARAPRLVTQEMVMSMSAGSVVVDVAIDQGGSIETIDHITSHSDPTYIRHGVIHYAVPNMPGAVPRTSTIALTNATLTYGLQIAAKGYKQAAKESRPLSKGINTAEGRVTYKAVAEAHSLEFTPVYEILDDSLIRVKFM